MGSFVWDRHPEEAYANPYEYPAQEQFAREAAAVLHWLSSKLNPRQMRFGRDERTAAKAIWMLQVDTLDSLREVLALLQEKRHRPAARLLRDAMETSDLAYWFAMDPMSTTDHLQHWYDNRSPPHRDFRGWLRSHLGAEASVSRHQHYQDLSRFVHRTYRALLKSYSVGEGDRLVYDGWSPNNLLVLPQTIAAYYALLGMAMQGLVQQLVDADQLTHAEALTLWDECLEPHMVPRRFTPNPPSAKLSEHLAGS